MQYPKISIITVVYNSEKLIERTIKSVLNQKYHNIEYIIIDGKSKDNTLQIINRYKDKISILVSEKDQGIYDAMNKGIKLATGDYVLFLNSGDEFYSVDTLDYIFTKLKPDADVYYGKTEIFNEHQQSLGERRLKPPAKLTWKSLRYGMVVCHQSFIVRRSLLGMYDLKYKIAADIDWMISCLKASKQIVNSEIFISKFVAGGVSRNNIIKSLRERFEIMLKNYGLITVLLCHLVISVKFFSYLLVNRKIN